MVGVVGVTESDSSRRRLLLPNRSGRLVCFEVHLGYEANCARNGSIKLHMQCTFAISAVYY